LPDGKAGLAGVTNGELLQRAEELDFDVLLTVDQNLPYEQRIEGRRIALLVLCARSNRLDHLLPLMPACLDALGTVEAGQVVRIMEGVMPN
jgi:hypothetical protein